MTALSAIPNFLCIGAPKAGTTTLYHHLRTHPQVFVTTPKELNFFSHDERYARGWGWYFDHFKGIQPGQLAIGEFGVTYAATTARPQIIPRIQRHLRDVRFIYMVRDPVARMESSYLEDLLGKNRARSQCSFAEYIRRPVALDTSRYGAQYAAYAEAFGEDRLHVILLEQFQRDPQGELLRLSRFLGIDSTPLLEHQVELRNTAEEKRLDGPFLRLFRKVPGFARIRRALPAEWQNPLRQWLKPQLASKPVWSPDDLDWFLGEVLEDSQRILDRLSVPREVWTFRPSQPPEVAEG